MPDIDAEIAALQARRASERLPVIQSATDQFDKLISPSFIAKLEELRAKLPAATVTNLTPGLELGRAIDGLMQSFGHVRNVSAREIANLKALLPDA